MNMDSFIDGQALAVMEFARVAMSDAEIADSIADKMDMSDKELIGLREKLQEEMEREQTDEEKRNQEYVNGSGNICPFCKKATVSADGGVDVDGGVAYQRIRCESCGASWNDIYRLVGIDGVSEKGEMPESH